MNEDDSFIESSYGSFLQYYRGSFANTSFTNSFNVVDCSWVRRRASLSLNPHLLCMIDVTVCRWQ